MKAAVPWSRYVVFFAIAAGVCAADLALKHWMFANLPNNGGIWWLWTNVFGFQTSLNGGALFGMGQGFWAVFAALSVAAATAIVVWLFFFGAGAELAPDHRPGPGDGRNRGQPLRPVGPSRAGVRRPALDSTGPRRSRFHRHVPGRPMALAELQPGRQRPGRRRRSAGVAFAVCEAGGRGPGATAA